VRVELQVRTRQVAVVDPRLPQRVDDRRIAAEQHPQAQPVAIHRRHQRTLFRFRRFLLDQRGQRDQLAQIAPARLRFGAQLAGDMLEPLDHHPHQHRRRGVARQCVGFGEQIPFHRARVRIDVPHLRRRLLRGVDERLRRAEAMLLEDAAHLGDRQPFRERKRAQIDIPARQLVDHRGGRQRVGEAILAGLERSPFVFHPHRHPEGIAVADDPGVDQLVADRVDTGAGRDLDEDLRRYKTFVRLRQLAQCAKSPGAGQQQQHDEREQDAFHEASAPPCH